MRTLRNIFFVLVSFALIFLGALLLVWMRPSLVFNDRNILLFQEWFNNESRKLEWSEAHIEVSSRDFWSKEFKIQTSNLRFKNPSFDIRASQMRIHADLLLSWNGIQSLFIRDFYVRKLSVEGNSTERESDAEKVDQPGGFQVPRFPALLSKINYHKVFIELERAAWNLEQGNWIGTGIFEIQTFEALSKLKLDLEFQNPKKQPIVAHALASFKQNKIQRILDLNFNANILDRHIIHLKYDPNESQIFYLSLVDQEKKVQITARGDLSLKNGELHVDQHVILEAPFGRKRLEIKPFLTDVRWEEKLEAEFRGKWLTSEIWNATPHAYRSYTLKNLSGNFEVSTELNSDSGSFITKGSINTVRAKNSLWEGDADVNFEFISSTEKLLEGLKGNLNIDLNILNFHQLVQILNNFGVLIPAPFHVLRGPIHLKLHSDFSQWEKSIPVDVSLSTDLKSKSQNFQLKADAELFVPRDFRNAQTDIGVNLILQDVLLVAPDLGIRPPPRLVPDPRFDPRKVPNVKKSVSEDEKDSVQYKIHVQTSPKPLRIRSGLAEEPVAIRINATFTDNDKNAGWLRIDPVTLSVFRREARVIRAELILKPELESSELDAEVVVDYADYDVFIRLLGTVGQPEVIFDSDPPLSREDIIAVLLFGSPIQDLDFEESSSVANAQAAFVDRSVTLASMYFLASTPVESISYNPETRMFRAKVRLPGGVSLSIGSDTETISEVGLIKRLGRGFRIRTEVRELGQDQEDREISAFIEWLLRY